MLKKKKILIPGLVIILLMGAAAAVIYFFDLNRLKPVISRTVKYYTGRELAMDGDIRLQSYWPPTLMAENVAFQNAPWGSRPYMAKVKRAAFAVSLTSILRGEFRFYRIRLEEPEVYLEFNRAGVSNFLLDIPESEEAVAVAVPALAFNDILIQNGYFEYSDLRWDLNASVHVDNLIADIPGLDQPIQILFEGAFRGLPCSLDGSIGPIMAWIQPDIELSVALNVRLGAATARLEGAIRDPVHLQDISLVFKANGPSTREMAGVIDKGALPDLGPFTARAELTDRPGQLAINSLDVKIGSPDQVFLAATGSVGDLIKRKGFDLDLSLQTKKIKNLMLLADLPPPPIESPLSATATFSDFAANKYRLDDFFVTVDEETIQGHMDLDLSRVDPLLDLRLQSEHTRLGRLALNARMRGTLDRINMERLELEMGHKNLFKAFITGAAGSLSPLEDLRLDFHIMGNDMANLRELTGRPLPVQGPYALSGALIMADNQAIHIPELKIILNRSSIHGSLGLNIKNKHAILSGDLASQQINLERLLTPETLPDSLQKNLSKVGPSRLAFQVSGSIEHPALNTVDLQTRVDNLATLDIKGSVKNLLAMAGTDLQIAVTGSDLANLKNIVGRDIPLTGPYSLSARLHDAAENTYYLEKMEVTTTRNTFRGHSAVQLAGPDTIVSAQLATKNISLEALAEGQSAVLGRLRSKKDLGPFEVEAVAVLSGKSQRLETMNLAFGSDDFVRMRATGSMGNVTKLQDMQFAFKLSGRNISDLEHIAGRDIPLEGPYALSGEVAGHAPGNIMLRNLDLMLERNRFSGRADLNLSGGLPLIEAEISSNHFSLAPVTLEIVEPFKNIPDLGPVQLAFNLSEEDGAPALTRIDFRLGRESTIAVLLGGNVGNLNPIGDVFLDFEVHSQDLSLLNNAYGSRLSSGVPFHIIGRLDDPRPNKITVTALEALYGDSDLSGTASLDFTGDRPSLVARLSSHRLDLRPFIETPDQGDPPPQAPAPSKKPGKSVSTGADLDPNPFTEKRERGEPTAQALSLLKKSGKRVFSREHFDLTPLQKVTADVAFQGKEVLFRKFAFNDVDIGLRLKEGDLHVDPLKLVIGGGTAEGAFALQSGKSPPFMATSLIIHHFNIGPMLQQLDQESTLHGTLNTTIHLDGRGDSVAAMMAGLNGKVHLNIHDGQIESRQLALLERYLGSNVLELLNPFIKHPTHTTVNCLISTSNIKDGRADFKLILDTEQTALASAGSIDLKTEHLNIGIKPSPKKGFGDNHVGHISFSLKELSQPFGLGGTLAKPYLVLDPGRTIITAGKFAGAWLLGPVGLTLFFTDISLGKRNICEEAATLKGKD